MEIKVHSETNAIFIYFVSQSISREKWFPTKSEGQRQHHLTCKSPEQAAE